MLVLRVGLKYAEAALLAILQALAEACALARDSLMATTGIVVLGVTVAVLFVPNDAVAQAFQPARVARLRTHVVPPPASSSLMDGAVCCATTGVAPHRVPITAPAIASALWDAARAFLTVAWVLGFLVACYRRVTAWADGSAADAWRPIVACVMAARTRSRTASAR